MAPDSESSPFRNGKWTTTTERKVTKAEIETAQQAQRSVTYFTPLHWAKRHVTHDDMLVGGEPRREVLLYDRICSNLIETLTLLPSLERSDEVERSVRTSLHAVDEVITDLLRKGGQYEELEILTTFRSGLVEWLR